MTEEERKEILEWLAGPRDKSEGAELYRRLGKNLMLKRQFAVNFTEYVRKTLVRELTKMAGLTDEDVRTMERKAAFAKEIAERTDAIEADRAKSGQIERIPSIPDEAQKKIRFRERFPFLSEPDCPDVLKVMVADMFTAYGKSREARAALQAMPDTENGPEALALARDTVENYIDDRAIMDELVHYRDHRALLGRHPKVRAAMGLDSDEPDYTEMETAELVKKLNSANANVSKARRALEAADTEEKRNAAEERLEKWRMRLESIRAAVELRKKNY